MLILDKNIRIKSANKSFCKTFQVSEEESIGISLYKLGNNQWNIPRLRELVEEIVPKNNRFSNFEVEHIFPVIGNKIMLLNAHRIIQKSNNEELIVLSIIDITDTRMLALELQEKEKKMLKVQLEAEKKARELLVKTGEHFQQLVKGLPAAVYSCNSKGFINFYNDAAVEVCGRKPKMGKDLWCGFYKLFNLDGTTVALDKYPMAIALKEGHGVMGEELIIERPDGSKRHVLVHPQPQFDLDGEIIGAINMVIDITDAVMAKNELTKAKIDAEQKTQIAEDAVKAKQQFLSNMSHEIRTPMNAIIGFTNVLLKTTLDTSQKEYLNAIKISGDALIALINDILDLAKVNSGKMTFEETQFDLLHSITTILQLFNQKSKENNIKIINKYDTNIPSTLIGDPLRLRQILLNLLSNAIKFTKEGTISILIKILKEDDEKITIKFSINDTGIGIPENKLKTIFNSFEQASQETSRSYGGSGLGLAIVKQLVELQGGNISVTSKISKGSTFTFTLTFMKVNAMAVHLAQQKQKLIQEEATAMPSAKTIRVLVAEDVALNQLLIKIILMDFGFDFDIAINGKIAIEKLQESKYDIILMDLQMPEMDGFEATDFIRNKIKSNIPIIALTADVTAIDVAKCIAIGMNDYISKPIDEKLLYNKIIKYI